MNVIPKWLTIAVLALWILHPSTDAEDQQAVPTKATTVEKCRSVSLIELAAQEAQRPLAAKTPASRRMIRRMSKAPIATNPSLAVTGSETAVAPALATPSPPTSASFAAIADNDTFIPPDTIGTVGPNHIVTMVNGQMQVQNRSGGVLLTLSLDEFWAFLGNPTAFDPRVLYDPYNDRWIAVTVADAETPTSSLLVAVSDNGDPTGNWSGARFSASENGFIWADFPSVGFNKNWIVATGNLFAGSRFTYVKILAMDKADLYNVNSSTFGYFEFTDHSTDRSGAVAFTLAPAVTYDNSLGDEFLVDSWNGNEGKLRISKIVPNLDGSATFLPGIAFPSVTSTWDGRGGIDFAPQSGTTQGIDAGDDRMQTCIYRNGSLWSSHTVFLPLGFPTRCAAQWWQVRPIGVVEQFGRIDDSSGASFFAYPSIAVNANNDVLIGYSRFSASQYASGDYSFRYAADALNTLRSDTLLKSGQGIYFKTFGDAENRWGDYSATVVDPLNDLSLWTVQEYAATPVGNPSIDGSGQWGTWWGRVDPDPGPNALTVQITRPADSMFYPPADDVTVSATASNSSGSIVKVEFFANGAKVGESTSSPYTVALSNLATGYYDLRAVATSDLGVQQASTKPVTVYIGYIYSPVGTWTTAIKGVDKGIAYLTFADDFTLGGYGITLGEPGLFTISGTWAFTGKNGISAQYSEAIGGNNLVAGVLLGKATASKSVSGKVSTNVGQLSLKGAPIIAPPDLSGQWNGTVSQNNTSSDETYTLTTTSDTGVFDVTGSGNGYTISGNIIVTAGNVANAFLIADFGVGGQITRSLSGKFSATKQSLSLKGLTGQGSKIGLNIVRP